MNIDLLIKMANEISAYFAAEPDTEQAVKDVAGHLRRYWQGAGLSDLALRGVGLLAASEGAQSPPL